MTTGLLRRAQGNKKHVKHAAGPFIHGLTSRHPTSEIIPFSLEPIPKKEILIEDRPVFISLNDL